MKHWRRGVMTAGVLAVGVGCGGGDKGSSNSLDGGSPGAGGAATGSGGAATGSGGAATGSGGAASGSGGVGGTPASGGQGGAGGAAGASGSGGAAGASSGGTSGAGGVQGSGGASGAAGASTGGSSGTADAGSSCLGASLLSDLGKTSVLVGASMSDSIASSAPFDLRYLYLAGGLSDGPPCDSCAASCTAGGTTCANSGPGCAWWGCWQYDQDPPGAYARGFASTAKDDGQIPMFTYYVILQASGADEGAGEVAAVNDVAFMQRYLADWRFLLEQIGSDVAFLHIEPDFWGYAEQQNEDPSALPAAVASANPTDCASNENSIAGLGRCMIAMVRQYAPNAKVGLHGSGWATKIDVLTNSNASLDVAAEARKLAAFLKAAGGADGDFVVVDPSDRDAAWYDTQGQDRWWDDTNATLPNFTQAFEWAGALAEEMGLPIVWWQIPVGNESLSNTNQAWQDNRVDYFFAHMDEVAAAHGVALAFGAGDGNQTTPSTDGGNLVSKVTAYGSARQALCE